MSSNKYFIHAEDLEFLEKTFRDVKKLHNRYYTKEPNIAVPDIISKTPSRSNVIDVGNKDLSELILADNSGLDAKSTKKMDKGNFHIEARIDLHGYTIDQAFGELSNFVIQSWNENLRMLLVITGKGRGNMSIRGMLVQWLNQSAIRPYILRVSVASFKHGSDGAFYVLLKRSRFHK